MLNDALRLIRVFGGISQTELAQKLGVTKSWISEIESGRKVPTIALLSRYAEVFDLPLSSILFFSEQMENRGSVEKARSFVSKKVIAILDYIAAKSDEGSDHEEPKGDPRS